MTLNRPKCLVPVNNIPILFHLFNKYKNLDFVIIGDYKYEVLEKYLKTYAKNINYKLIKSSGTGNVCGIKDALKYVKEDEKIKVGIDPEWDSKTIADKIEKGEIEIPAKLELDVQMSEDIKDMRLMMMNQLGLVSDDELKLKVGYEVDESTVDNLTPDEQKVAVELIAENEDEFNKLTEEEKEVVVDFVSDDSALEALENH